LDVFDLDAASRRVGACALEEERIGVEARHTRSAGGEPVRDSAVPAGHVEHLVTALEPEQAPEAIRLNV
jgi:hypothetical protein